MAKILVLGCNGMAGHVISMYLSKQGHFVEGYARSESEFLSVTHIGDVTDFNRLKNVLNNDYDVVVNAVGLLNQTAEDNKSSAVLINSYLPHFLKEYLERYDTKVIQMSTDCVFSGNRGRYTESEFPDGDTFYDRSKALGELNDTKNLTFRNSIIGPDIKESGIGLFNWFMKQTSCKGFSRAIWSGVTTLELAKAIDKAISTNLTGLYHLTNNVEITKLDLLRLSNDIFRKGEVDIIENDEVSINKSLLNTRTDFDFIVGSYEDMLREMLDWINENKKIYPNYYR